MRTSANQLFAAACALSLAACEKQRQPCFTPASVIEDLRVLAVRVDPPEPVVDLDAGDVPAINVSALLVAGSLDRNGRGSASETNDAAVVARFCVPPLDPDRPQTPPGCPADSIVAGQSPLAPTLAAPLVLRPSVDLLRRSIDADPLRGLGGIKLRMQLDFTRGARLVSTTKTLLFHQAGQPGSVNHAVELAGVEVDYGISGQVQRYSSNETIPLVVTQVVNLRPLLGTGLGAAGPIEDYDALNPDGSLSRLREHVSYRFYAANTLVFQRPDYSHVFNAPIVTFTGTAGGDEADEPDDPTAVPHGLVSAFDAWQGNQAGDLWIVARDGRGAEAWLRVGYSAIEERQNCMIPGGGCPLLYFGCQ